MLWLQSRWLDQAGLRLRSPDSKSNFYKSCLPGALSSNNVGMLVSRWGLSTPAAPSSARAITEASPPPQISHKAGRRNTRTRLCHQPTVFHFLPTLTRLDWALKTKKLSSGLYWHTVCWPRTISGLTFWHHDHHHHWHWQCVFDRHQYIFTCQSLSVMQQQRWTNINLEIFWGKLNYWLFLL